MKIKVYSSLSCPYCLLAKQYLKEKGKDFEEINISTNKKAAQEIFQKTGKMGVPVIEFGDKFVFGFNKSEIDKLLASNA